jgi:hypothetical protein
MSSGAEINVGLVNRSQMDSKTLKHFSSQIFKRPEFSRSWSKLSVTIQEEKQYVVIIYDVIIMLHRYENLGQPGECHMCKFLAPFDLLKKCYIRLSSEIIMQDRLSVVAQTREV